MSGKDSYNGNEISQKLTLDDARQKIARFCAYQERAHAEVEEKLYSFGLNIEQVGDLLAWLITENYVNEERFAIAFAGGKFRIKKWGKLKIKQHLQQKKVSNYSLNKALDAIDDEEYINVLDGLIEARAEQPIMTNIFEFRHKLSRSLINKGYEPDIVWDRINLLVTHKDH